MIYAQASNLFNNHHHLLYICALSLLQYAISMDNQHSVGGFLQHLLDANPRIGQAIQHYVRGLTNHQAPPPREPSLPLDDPDLADMPPLEPVSDDLSSRGSSPEVEELDDVARSVGDLSLTSHPTPDSAIQNQGASSSTVPLAEASWQQGPQSGMSSLHGVPNSEADVDMVDVDHALLQDTPAHSLPQTGSRRARVEDEADEEDVRATNRQRMSSPGRSDDTHSPESRPPTPHASPQQQDAPPNHPPPPYPGGGYLFSFDIFPGPALNVPEQPQADAAQEQEHHHHHHHHHPTLPMFNFTLHIPVTPGAPAGEQAGANGAPPARGFPPQLFPSGTEAFFMPFFPFGLPRQEEVDDPERAEKLIRGLEEVPDGLVTRIETLGDDGGDSVCSICWEKLSSEGGGFDEQEQERQADSEVDVNARMDVDDRAAASPSLTEKPSTAKDLPKVVALPCSHVFHTSCLLPWFSKPHRTTCPSCRFDIDPESLTYVPPRQRRQQRAPSAQTPPQAPAGAQPPQAQPATDAQPAAVPTQATPGVPPAAQPSSHAAPGNAAGQSRPGHPLGMPLEFNLFFPVMAGGQGGPAPTYIPLDPETTRNIFQRLFGDTPQPVQQVPREPRAQTQEPQPAPAANAATPDATPTAQAAPTAGGPDNWGIPNLWQNLFGVQPPRAPQGTANPATAAGAAPQRAASAASTGQRGQGRARPPEKRQWTPPAPPGQTLRQRVERLERERGLRCWDVSCGLGPTDEDPIPVIEPLTIRQICINKIGGHGEKVCEHTFHPSCLVSAERVAGWGAEDMKEEKEGEEEVEVSCPLCRTVGVISRTDWDEGACALA